MKPCTDCSTLEAQLPQNEPHPHLDLVKGGFEKESSSRVYECAVCHTLWFYNDTLEKRWNKLDETDILARLIAFQKEFIALGSPQKET